MRSRNSILQWISGFFKATYLYIAGIASISIIYVLLLSLSQGRDVVIQVGEYLMPFACSLLCILLWAFLNWYGARLLSYSKQYRGSDIPTWYFRHFPRLIALNSLVAVQAGILSLPTLQEIAAAYPFQLRQWYFILPYIIAHQLLYLQLSWEWEAKYPRARNWRYWLARAGAALYMGWMVYMVFIFLPSAHDRYNHHAFWLTLMLVLLFIAEILMTWFFIHRRKIIDRRAKAMAFDEKKEKIIAPVKLNEDFKKAETHMFKWFLRVALAALGVFILTLISYTVSDWFGALAILLLGLGVLVLMVNLVSYFSIQLKFNLHIVFWGWAFLNQSFFHPYDVTTTEMPSASFARRPTVREHLSRWMSDPHRSQLIDSSSEYVVYIVLSNGGGSLSGNWVASMLSQLEDKSRDTSGLGYFSDHLLCMAGASGGSIGNMIFYNQLSNQRRLPQDTSRLYWRAHHFFSGDFLSYTLAHLLGPDIWRHLLPLPFTDRARALELSMIRSNHDSVIGKLIARRLDTAFDYSGRLPAFYINTTEVDNGMPGEIASVRLPDQSQRTDVLDLLDRTNDSLHWTPQSLQFATAGVLSSRFPYVSPAGRLRNLYFVDGGYFDNSGAGIVLEYLQQIKQLKDDTSVVFRERFGKLRFHVIHITHGLSEDAGTHKEIGFLTNDLAAPLKTLVGIFNASTTVGDGQLKSFLANYPQSDSTRYSQLNLFRNDDKEDNYPMSWVMSDYYMRKMEIRADSLADSVYWKQLRIDFWRGRK